MTILFLLVIALFIFTYHYERNGNPWGVGDTMCRIIWAASVVVGYLFLSIADINWAAAAWILPGSFMAILVPHGFCMNMGRWAVPWSVLPLSKKWPGLWLPSYTQEEYSALPQSKKTRLDILGMLSVGAIRGVLVFSPLMCVRQSLVSVLGAALVVSLSQPAGYYLSWFMPVSGLNCHAHSAEWGEVFVAIGWAVSLVVLVCL